MPEDRASYVRSLMDGARMRRLWESVTPPPTPLYISAEFYQDCRNARPDVDWSGFESRLEIQVRRNAKGEIMVSFKDAARAVMPEDHHDAITGHTNGSVGRSYGRGVPLKVLAESVAKITYLGLL